MLRKGMKEPTDDRSEVALPVTLASDCPEDTARKNGIQMKKVSTYDLNMARQE